MLHLSFAIFLIGSRKKSMASPTAEFIAKELVLICCLKWVQFHRFDFDSRWMAVR